MFWKFYFENFVMKYISYVLEIFFRKLILKKSFNEVLYKFWKMCVEKIYSQKLLLWKSYIKNHALEIVEILF